MPDKRPFVFRINAAELFAEISVLSKKEKSNFIEQFSHDLLTLKPVLSYSEKVISETLDYIEKKKLAGMKGGRPKKAEVNHSLSTTKAQLKQTESKPKANQKPEEEVKEKEKEKEKAELPLWLSQKDWEDFVAHRIAIKKPMTELAASRIIKKLDSMRAKYDVSKLIDLAIRNQWQDIYEKDECLLHARSFMPANNQPYC